MADLAKLVDDLSALTVLAMLCGLAALFLVTPIEAQRDLCESILAGWRAEGEARNDHRSRGPRARGRWR